MASDDTSGAKPAGPVAIRIKLRYDDVDALVQRFAINVGRSGLFLPTRSLQPIGAEVKFELRLANDTPVLVGLGRVKAARPPDAGNARAAFGLSIELMRVTREGREVIMRMLERRRELGLPELAIPMPDDVEAARRIESEARPESQPRAESTGVTSAVPEPIAAVASAPALAPEPPRAKRPKLADIVAKAAELSAPVAAVDVEGPNVDVGRALARARALAGGDMDRELDALRDSSAAPVAIDVEAASAALAQQLGGTAIARRERSARWARPPAIAPIVEPESTPVDAGAELLSFERQLDAARVHTGVSMPAVPSALDEDDDDSGEMRGEYTQVAAGNPFAQHPDEAEEVSELDVLAEADAGEDDELAVTGDRDSSAFPLVKTQPAAPAFVDPDDRASDFAETDDRDFTVASADPRPYPRGEFHHDTFTPPPPDERIRGRGTLDDVAARLAFDDEGGAPLAGATEPPPLERAPSVRGAPRPTERDPIRRDPAERDPIERLDHALSSLEGDTPVPVLERRRPPPRARPVTGRRQAPPPSPPTPRATAADDGGRIIDFDNDVDDE